MKAIRWIAGLGLMLVASAPASEAHASHCRVRTSVVSSHAQVIAVPVAVPVVATQSVVVAPTAVLAVPQLVTQQIVVRDAHRRARPSVRVQRTRIRTRSRR